MDQKDFLLALVGLNEAAYSQEDKERALIAQQILFELQVRSKEADLAKHAAALIVMLTDAAMSLRLQLHNARMEALTPYAPAIEAATQAGLEWEMVLQIREAKE